MPTKKSTYDTTITIKIKERHEFDIEVKDAQRSPPIRAVEDALTMAMRRYLEHQHQAGQAAKILETAKTQEA